MRGGEHDNRHARVVELEVAEKIEAARSWQGEIEEHEGHVGLVVEHVGRLGRVARGQHGDIGVELRKKLREGLDDQRVIVDHKNLHAFLPGSGCTPAAPLSRRDRGEDIAPTEARWHL